MTIWKKHLASLARLCRGGKRAAWVAALIVALLVLALASPIRGMFKAPPGAYETHPVTLGVVERSISATGAVKALVTVDVGSRVSGIIAEVKVNFNDDVEEGQVLAVIDRAPFEAKMAAATASLAQARAAIGLQEAMLAKSQSQFAQNERDAKRFRGMARGQAASEMSTEQAETQAAVSRNEIAIAQAQLASAKAVVAQREADLRQAKIDLDYTQILSPIDGVVIDRKIQPGQTVAATYQTPILFQIARDLSQILIYAQVDEADIGGVRSGAPAQFTVDAYPEETFEGVVEQVRLAATRSAAEAANPAAAAATAAAQITGPVTYTAVVTAQNPGKRLLPDMTATVRIVSGQRENVRSAPNEALKFRPSAETDGDKQEGPASGVLWVVDASGKLQRRAVRLGLKGDSSTEILDGDVKPGDLVALRAMGGTAAK
ncbi:MAG: efflux RND transporter periplasmic adaptor subunit [Methylocystis sp.]